MKKCMDCRHWSPATTTKAMAVMGFARCLQRPTPGLTMSAHARRCEQFAQADEKTTKPRHAKWVQKDSNAND